jgi:cell wall-associated NlpC family hydrolase
MRPDAIIAAARSVLYVPFRHQGRNPVTGLDCGGLIIYVGQQIGQEVLDLDEGYARTPSGGKMEALFDSQPNLTRVYDLLPGDVLMMRFAREPQHLGIYTGTNLIHTWSQVGKVCEHGFIKPWPQRVVRVYRFNGVVHE